jgi:hypothetical protein
MDAGVSMFDLRTSVFGWKQTDGAWGSADLLVPWKHMDAGVPMFDLRTGVFGWKQTDGACVSMVDS